jgi:hypothetical protein
MFMRGSKRTIFIKEKSGFRSYKGSGENNTQDLNFYIPAPDVAQLCEFMRIHIFSPAAVLSYRSGMNFTSDIQSFLSHACVCVCVCACVCVLYCLRTLSCPSL